MLINILAGIAYAAFVAHEAKEAKKLAPKPKVHKRLPPQTTAVGKPEWEYSPKTYVQDGYEYKAIRRKVKT